MIQRAFLILLLLFSNVASAADPAVVRVLMGAPEASHWKPFVLSYNSSQSEIQLEVIEGPNATNLVEDLYTSSFLLGDSPYDLVFMDIVWVPKFAAAGWLEPLEPYFSASELRDYLQADLDGGTYQGQLYRLPFRSDAGMLYFRRDILEDMGEQVPTTFKELLRISQRAQREKRVKWGYLWQGKQYEGLSAMFIEVLQGSGGFWINPDTLEVGLDSPEAHSAVAFLKQTIQQGVSPEGVSTYQEEETRRLFQSGNALFLRNWPYVYGLASAEHSPIAGKLGITSMVHKESNTSGACLGGWGLGLARSARQKQAAIKVMKHFAQKHIQQSFFSRTGFVPARTSLFTNPALVEKFPHFPRLLPILENAALRPPIPQYAQASDILQRHLSAAVTGAVPTKHALQSAALETRALLGKSDQ